MGHHLVDGQFGPLDGQGGTVGQPLCQLQAGLQRLTPNPPKEGVGSVS